MNTYENTIKFSGDGQNAFNIALQSFLPLGFRIEKKDENNLVLSGVPYYSTRQSPLQGISQISFTLRPGTLSVQAELGGTHRLQKYLRLFLIVMAAGFFLLFSALWLVVNELRAYPWIIATAVAPFIPWLFIMPLMDKWIHKRSLHALETLLSNMTF